MKAIDVKDLEYVYMARGDSEPARALNNISFSVDEGEFVAVVGRNGSGNPPLARHLNGLCFLLQALFVSSGNSHMRKI